MKLVDTIADLRWLLFSKYSCEVSKLPPTMSALKYRIFRAHYAAWILKKCTSSIQNLPDPSGFGWELDNGNLVPIMTGGLPAPTGLIELSMCSCKTGCSSGRRTCKKNNLCYVLKCASIQMPVKIPIVTKRRTYMKVKTKFPILSDRILSNISH